MAVALYMDVHVPAPITEQLRRRQVDVLTAIADGWGRRSDDELLQHALEIGRVLFTQDIRFRALGEEWQRQGRPFAGLLFGHQLRGTIGQYVEDLELIAKASEPDEWKNRIEYLPF
jgi:hypothetical protein